MNHFNKIMLLNGVLLFALSFLVKLLDLSNITVYLYIASIIMTGSVILRTASKSLLAKRIDENILILLAVCGFIFIGKWLEASFVIILFSLGQLAQNMLIEKSKSEPLTILPCKMQEQITRLEDSELVECDVKSIQPNDILIINTGEILPVDAIIKEGQALVRHTFNDRQTYVHKVKEGDYVLAGSFTMNNKLVVIAKTTFEDSLCNMIQELPYKNQKTIQLQQKNDFSRSYALMILLFAIFAAFVPWYFFSKSLIISCYYSFVSIAVLASFPLLRAIPITTAAFSTQALEKNIIFKNPFSLENANKINAIAFDKASTLTSGQLTATNIYAPYPFSQLEILYSAVPLMKLSQSPLSQAFIPQAEDLASPYQAKLEEDTDIGFSGIVENKPIIIGKNSFLEKKGIKTSRLLRKYAEYQAIGSQALFIAIDGQAAGLIGLRDDIRPEAFTMIRALQKIGTKNIFMLTSDHENAAAAFTRPLGLSSISNLVSTGKKHIMAKLHNEYGSILMIGDPIKDSASLANADLSIAICNNINDTKDALAIADIVLLSDDITEIPEIFTISKKFNKLVSKNTKIMLLGKFICLLLAFSALLNLWEVLIIDAILSSFIVYLSTKTAYK